jgi:hypothetical protein
LSNEANTSSASFEGVDVGAEVIGVTVGIFVAASGVPADVVVGALGAVAAAVAVTVGPEVGSMVGAGTHPPSVAEPANTTSMSILTRRVLSMTPNLLADWKHT